MRVILFVDEKGTQEGDCDFREIELCEEDGQNLFVMIGHSLSVNNKLERVEVLSKKKYHDLIKIRDSHPDYKLYVKAQETINDFKRIYGELDVT